MEHHSPDKNYIKMLEDYEGSVVVFGDAAFTQLSARILLDGNSVLLLITGGQNSYMKSGAYQAFINMALGIDGIETPLYQGVPAEPDVACVRDIVKMMNDVKPDTVAALGGGSVLDAAKAAYLSWQTGLDVTELFGVNVASERFPGKEFKRVSCIPTTAGTGSEVTPYANIVDREKDLKFLIADQQMVPDLALIDPGFTKSMPPALTATTALDAMTHAVESLLNSRAGHPEGEEWALESIRLIRYALPRVLENPEDLLCREMLAAAATLAGMCIRFRPTALPHLCSYSMWGKVPHGLAVALLLPHFWRYYLAGDDDAIRTQTMKLAGIFASENEQKTPEDVVRACEDFIAKVSPYKKLAEIEDFDANLVKKIAADAAKNPVKLQTAPRSIPVEEAADILNGILSKAL